MVKYNCLVGKEYQKNCRYNDRCDQCAYKTTTVEDDVEDDTEDNTFMAPNIFGWVKGLC